MKKHEQGSLLHAVAWGSGVALAITVGASLLTALLLQKGVLAEAQLVYAKLAILFLALFAGGLLAARRAGRQRAAAAVIPAAVVCLLGLICKLTVWREGMPQLLTTLCPAAAAALFAAFLSAKKKKHYKR